MCSFIATVWAAEVTCPAATLWGAPSGSLVHNSSSLQSQAKFLQIFTLLCTSRIKKLYIFYNYVDFEVRCQKFTFSIFLFVTDVQGGPRQSLYIWCWLLRLLETCHILQHRPRQLTAVWPPVTLRAAAQHLLDPDHHVTSTATHPETSLPFLWHLLFGVTVQHCLQIDSWVLALTSFPCGRWFIIVL